LKALRDEKPAKVEVSSDGWIFTEFDFGLTEKFDGTEDGEDRRGDVRACWLMVSEFCDVATHGACPRDACFDMTMARG
jgi:hypothetical protein